jgi:hypothetical protein
MLSKPGKSTGADHGAHECGGECGFYPRKRERLSIRSENRSVSNNGIETKFRRPPMAKSQRSPAGPSQ